MGIMKVTYDDDSPVQGAKIYLQDYATGREGLYGVTNSSGEIIVTAPPPWYTHGTYNIVVDAGNARVGTFWGYVLGFMTPDYVTIHITRSGEPDIIGPIDYPVYHQPASDSWKWTIVIIIIFGIVVYVGYKFIEMWRSTGHE